MTNAATTDDSVAILKSIGKVWWFFALFGVITVAFGIVLTIKPGKSVHTIAVIFGIWLLILGVVRLIQAIGATGERTGYVVTGLLAILIAILLLHHTTTTVAVVGFIVGIFWTISGAAQILHGFTADEGKISWPIVLLGVVGLVVGILCLVYPSLSLSIICVIVGLGLIVYGLVEILAGFQVRQLKKVS
jgi:uncharacterized membrane protein HdeD (DUF308 family)